MSKSAIFKWDCSFGIADTDISKQYDVSFIKKMCKETAKQHSFQLEKGENTGFIHYQMRLNLYKKVRKPQLLSLIRKYLNEDVKYFYCAPLTKGADFYAYTDKMQTRIGETYSDADDDNRIKEMTTQLKEFYTFELRPYQQKIKDIILAHELKPDFRSIYFIQDKIGGLGKSIFCEALSYEGLAKEVPPYNSIEKISEYVASQIVDKSGKKIGKASSAYIIDMPRSSKNDDSTKKDRIGGFLGGIEVLKNGLAIDSRYSAREVRFNRPMIIVFCNKFPDSFEGLTRNRWKCYNTTQDYDIERYEYCPGLMYELEQQQQNELTMLEDTSDNIIQEVETENVVCGYTPDKLDKLV
jgi:hypothetical protein